MTQSPETRHVKYPSPVTNGVYPIPFRYLAGVEIAAHLRNEDGSDPRPLVHGVDFTVDPQGDTEADDGALTLLASPQPGTQLHIEGATTLAQYYRSTPGAEGVEAQFDRDILAIQELERKLARVPVLAPGFAPQDPTFPVPVFGKALVGNAAETGWMNADLVATPVVAENVLLRVPSEFPTVQEALGAAQGIILKSSARITILLEAGFAWPSQVSVFGGDYSHVQIVSQDAVVLTAESFPANHALISFLYCTAPHWALVVDMQLRGDNGVELNQSRMNVRHRCGMRNAGAQGNPHREAWGSNFVVLGDSGLFCDPVRETLLERTGHTAAGGTVTTFPLAEEDREATGYYIGAAITVLNGSDTTGADIIDYDGTTNVVTLRWSDRWSVPNNGAGLNYRIELLRGLIATGGARRGVTSTWASNISISAGNLRNNGTNNRDPGHAALFFRRGSTGQIDRVTMTGSAAGARCARAGMLSARQCYFTGIAGNAIVAAEGASIAAADSAFLRCGVKAGGELPELPVLFLSSAEGRGGKGNIDAAGCEFDDSPGPIARIDAEAGSIDLGDSRAFNIGSYLATADGGNIDCTRVKGSTAADAATSHVVFASNLEGATVCIGMEWDAQSGAQYIVRTANDGRANVSGATFSGWTIKPFDVDEASHLYVEETTINGSLRYPIGVELGPNANLPNRQTAVHAIEDGWAPSSGTVFQAGGLTYKQEMDATAISDMANVVPVDPAPGHFAALPDGTDSTTAIKAFLAFCAANDIAPNWGDGQTWTCTGNIDGFLNANHIGAARIVRGSDDMHIGAWLTPNGNVVYVSPTGTATADGLTSGTPTTQEKAFAYIARQGKLDPGHRWAIDFAAGTYSPTTAVRFENWPTLAHRLELRGKASGGDATVIIDGTSADNNWLRCLRDNGRTGLQGYDLMIQNFPDSGMHLHSGANDLEFERVSFKDNGAAGASIRGGHADFIGPAVAEGNTGAGIVLQGVYGASGQKNGGGASGYTYDGNGVGFSCTRHSNTYCSGSTFKNNVKSIEVDRNSRCRRQDNVHESWTGTPAITVGAGGVLDYDPDRLDSFAGLAAGKAAIWVNNYTVAGTLSDAQPTREEHAFWIGSHEISDRTDRHNIAVTGPGLNELAPYRMGDYWLFNERAHGWLSMMLDLDAGVDLTMHLASDSSSHNVAGWKLPSKADASTWLIDVEFTGPVPGTTFGRYTVRATRESVLSGGDRSPAEIYVFQGATDDLSLGNQRAKTGADIKWRLYGQMSVASKSYTMRELRSWKAE
ncbi:hypothetical protein [Oceaniglobus trochenteri]|uniref:hypothetical protein n=1 Tax=Oceaniglobus trochenteri TaxID=2763260 RepID=UPI001D000E88|nr:hypothetical protein [Oceaniglobus trochenteri]